MEFPVTMMHPNKGKTLWRINAEGNLTQSYYNENGQRIFSWEILPEDAGNVIEIMEAFTEQTSAG